MKHKLVKKEGAIVIGRHGVDAVGWEFDYQHKDFNGCASAQEILTDFLAERTAETVKEYIVEKHGIEGGDDDDLLLSLAAAFERGIKPHDERRKNSFEVLWDMQFQHEKLNDE